MSLTTRLVACALLLCLLPAAPLARQAAPVSGAVYLDANGNGTRDPEEKGIGSVAVSNQIDVVATGSDGSYRLPSIGLGVVFVSVPDGHEASGRFWMRPEGGRADFGLRQRPAPADYSFVHASDTHVNAQSVARFERVRRWVAAERPAFVLVSGDLVQDALRVGEAEARGYYDLYVKAAAAFPVPVWSVPGNHENFGIERHLSLVSPKHPLYGKQMYRSYLGPTYYSFTYGGIHFVGLDSVDIDDLWYYGHVDQPQLAWLTADLARIPAGTPVVTFNHIPFVTAAESISGFREDPAGSLIRVNGKLQYRHAVSNLADVLPLLAPYRWTLALGGHIHRYETLRFASSVTTRFNQTAAIAGPVSGTIPATSGFTVYRVHAGTVDDGTFVPLDSLVY
jgi:3',5'-cyclic AMP phosphodiesterase CpdA